MTILEDRKANSAGTHQPFWGTCFISRPCLLLDHQDHLATHALASAHRTRRGGLRGHGWLIQAWPEPLKCVACLKKLSWVHRPLFQKSMLRNIKGH